MVEDNSNEPDTQSVAESSGGMSTGKKIGIGLGLCCIGLIIIILIAGVMSPDKTSTSNTKNNDNGNSSDDGVTLVLGGKPFKIYGYSDEIIKNIQGNNSDTIDINAEDGRKSYMIIKATNDTTILNELDPKDNVTKITKDNITYQNIVFYDGTPSTTVFKTRDGSIYEISYYNGNDFLFDYQSFGKQMNQ